MIYFEKKGKHNTDDTVRIAIQRAKELKINFIVVASCSGETALKFSGCGMEVVCVTHQIGFNKPGEDEMDRLIRNKLQQEDINVLTTTHLFAGVDRALRYKFQGIFPAEIISNTLRMFGQGMKVCIEISSMALDAGLIPYGEEIIAVGGSGKGADTAMVLTPAHSSYIFDTNVKEILCMPRGH
ncbi:MAG: pyruvate kinase alpha/beta domain-containing protein [Bacillota bacterium]|jgi:hypothetical protein